MSPKSRQLTTCLSLAEFFREEVDNAIRAQALEASIEVEFYLVNLLEAYSKTDSVRLGLDQPLALLLHRAVFSSQTHRLSAYRRLGDISLYLAGLFAPLLRRRSVDVNYAIGMGTAAYAAVATLVRSRTANLSKAVQPLYLEMSEKFPALVEVLTQICERTDLGADSPELVELYERWARTQGPHLVARLQDLGVWPGNRVYSA